MIPAAVAFYSLVMRSKVNVFYDMYVLHSDITKENQALLISILQNKANLKFINTHSFLDDFWNKGNFDFNNRNTQFTADTIVRCFSSRFFPDYDIILYSDVDVVFVDDISELYNISLEDNYLAAVKSAFLKSQYEELSHLKPEHYEMLKDTYFAGGIWLLNLKKIREDKLEEECLEILQDNTIIKRWNDQDIMNIACKNKVSYIPLNYISYPYLDMRIQDSNFDSHYSKEELYDSLFNPKIIHYAGLKPWKDYCNKSEYWWEIFHYLQLPCTNIIKRKNQDDLPIKTVLEKKTKKYNTLFKICLLMLVLSILLNIILFFE